DHAVDGGEVLGGAAGQGAIELVQRARRRQRLRAFDLCALELTSEEGLEAADLLAGQRQLGGGALALDEVAGLGAQAERAADALDVDAEHAGALAAAAEGGDRQAGEVSKRRFVAVADRLEDLVAQRVVIDPLGAGAAAGLLALAHAGLD